MERWDHLIHYHMGLSFHPILIDFLQWKQPILHGHISKLGFITFNPSYLILGCEHLFCCPTMPNSIIMNINVNYNNGFFKHSFWVD